MLKAIWENFTAKAHKTDIYAGALGEDGHLPAETVTLSDFHADTVTVSQSGPERGVQAVHACTPDFELDWGEDGAENCYGESRSLYDASPVTGRCSGDPIADCFALLSYRNATIMAVADGVNWGEPARRAARCAVLGCISHLHKAMVERKRTNPGPISSDCVFKEMLQSIKISQKLILAQCGTMTTLVLTVVAKCKNLRIPQQWAALTLNIGDSPAFVYRQHSQRVEELTYASHAGTVRDPRWTPGALGYAQGDDPDLTNMCCTLTLLREGDIVFLTSDGVADNFDPVILKTAKYAPLVTVNSGDSMNPADPRSPGSPATASCGTELLEPEQVHAKQMGLLEEVLRAHCAERKAMLGGGNSNITARSLVRKLLDHVFAITEAQRDFAVKRAAAREAAAAVPRELRSLSTDIDVRSVNEAKLIPGKMDHATVAAFQVPIKSLRRPPKKALSANLGSTHSSSMDPREGCSHSASLGSGRVRKSTDCSTPSATGARATSLTAGGLTEEAGEKPLGRGSVSAPGVPPSPQLETPPKTPQAAAPVKIVEPATL